MPSRFLRSKICIPLLCLTLLGCAGTREITDLEDHLSPTQLTQHHQSVDAVKRHYFTKDAYQAIKDIPAIDGPTFSGYAAGVNFWSNLASLLSFNGVGRKVILTDSNFEQWGAGALVHEYIHHLDDLDRDGEAEFIDHQEFRKAYLMMANDRQWGLARRWVELRSNDFVTTWFGIGEMAEHIAYMGEFLTRKGGPDYMKFVYRKILNLTYNKVSTYTKTNGKQYTITLGE